MSVVLVAFLGEYSRRGEVPVWVAGYQREVNWLSGGKLIQQNHSCRYIWFTYKRGTVQSSIFHINKNMVIQMLHDIVNSLKVHFFTTAPTRIAGKYSCVQLTIQRSYFAVTM